MCPRLQPRSLMTPYMLVPVAAPSSPAAKSPAAKQYDKKEFGRVTSRAYDRFRCRYTAELKKRTGRTHVTPRDAALRDSLARRRYAEAARRFHAQLPELTPEELLDDAFFA